MSLAFKDPLLGTTIAQRYRLISRLGSGGMASVYLSRHVLIERLSAIKLLNADLGENPDYRDRFLREARAVNRINHPNIVEITDYGEGEGRVYLVMEYVPGESLSKALVRGPVGWRRAASIGLQVASALGRAHQMGVIHRDLKPGNILLVERKDGDQVKLTDFGVAKMIDATTLTSTAVALGTPGYVAPEYHSFGSIDARSDLFSLGVVIYESACGALPFDAALQTNCMSSILPRLPRIAERCPDAPRFFDEVVMTLLAIDPDDRPRDGYEAFDLLRRLAESEGIASPVADPPGGARGSEGVGPPSSGPSSSGSGGDPRYAIANEPTFGGTAPSGIVRRSGPHLTTVSSERIGPLCARALDVLLAQARAAPERFAPQLEVLAESQRLVASTLAIARMVAVDTAALEAAQAHGRNSRAELGNRLDEVAREHSKTLGWAGTIAERTYQVHTARTSGEHSVPAVEAMVWEQAALEQEEDRARDRAAELAAAMRAQEAELERENLRLEHELLVTTAQLEGRIAALRSVALEAALLLEQTAAGVGLRPQDLRAGPKSP